MLGKYLTVINKHTRKAVPFVQLPNGEIQIVSTDPANNEDTCIVTLANIFYEFSGDFVQYHERI